MAHHGSTGEQVVPLGLAYLTVPGAHPVEQIEAAAETGFALVGLRLAAPIGLRLAYDPVADPGLRRTIAAALRTTGVRFYDADALTLAAATDLGALRRTVEVAAELGATLVQIVVEDPDRVRAADRFAALCDFAASLGLGVAVEFMRWRALRTLDDAAALLAAAARPNATICLDCLHFVRSGGTPDDIARIGADRIAYVQLCDAPLADPGEAGLLTEARGGRLHPGEGSLPLAAILAALAPSTVLTVEAPRAADVDRAPRERARLAHEATRSFLAHFRDSLPMFA